MTAQLTQEARELAQGLIDEGFWTFDEVVEMVWESRWDGEPDDFSFADAQAAVAVLWDARLVEQQTWQTPTSGDRLEAAFTDLLGQGVIARMNFECCGSCAHHAMQTVELQNWAGPQPPIGYVFFHSQWVESMVKGDPLHLAHRAFPGDGIDEPADAAIAGRVVAALARQRLQVKQDAAGGGLSVLVQPWRRRLPARPAQSVQPD